PKVMVFARSRTPRVRESASEGWVECKLSHGPGQGHCVAVRYDQPGPPVINQLRQAAGIGHHARHPTRHRFQNGIRRRLAPRRHEEYVEPGVYAVDFALKAPISNRLSAKLVAERSDERTVADEFQLHWKSVRPQHPRRRRRHVTALVLGNLADASKDDTS